MDNATIQRFLDEHDYDVRKTFLCLYIEKVLKDSGIYRMFEYFFSFAG